MADTLDNLDQTANRLGLKMADDSWYCGLVRDFPVGMKLVEPKGAGSLVFQARHPFNPEQKQISKLNCGEEVERLAEQEKLDLSIENRVTWLTLVDGPKHLNDRSAERLFASVLDAMERTGLKGRPERCHYCETETVRNVSCIDGKVVQICPTCLAQRTFRSWLQQIDSITKKIPLAIACPLAGIVGGMAWAFGWVLYDLAFEWLRTDQVQIPTLLMASPLLLLAFGVGGSAGWVLKDVGKNYYKFLRGALVILFTSLAIVLGEVLYLAWIIHRNFKSLAVNEAFRLLPQFWVSLNSSYLNFKVMAAVGALFMGLMVDQYSTKPKFNL